MVTLNEYYRLHNGILIYIPFEQWPADIPLPSSSELAHNSEGAISPYRRFVLEPEQTIEIFAGQFNLPMSPPQAWDWYQTHMLAQGWLKQEARQQLPVQTRLKYNGPLPADGVITCLTSEISLQQLVSPHQTRAILRRTAVTPYTTEA